MIAIEQRRTEKPDADEQDRVAPDAPKAHECQGADKHREQCGDGLGEGMEGFGSTPARLRDQQVADHRGNRRDDVGGFAPLCRMAQPSLGLLEVAG